MNRVFVLSLMLWCSLFPSCVLADGGQIFFPGVVLDGDLPNGGEGLNGATLSVLYRDGGKLMIGKTKVSYESDGDAGEISSGIKKDDVIVYFRNLDIKPGAAQEAVPEAMNPYDDSRWVSKYGMRIALGKQTYHVYRKNNLLIVAGRNGKSEVDFETAIGGVAILWAGDIDHDGQLDLIVDVQDASEKGSLSCLLLSSHARKPHITELAACHGFSG